MEDQCGVPGKDSSYRAQGDEHRTGGGSDIKFETLTLCQSHANTITVGYTNNYNHGNLNIPSLLINVMQRANIKISKIQHLHYVIPEYSIALDRYCPRRQLFPP